MSAGFLNTYRIRLLNYTLAAIGALVLIFAPSINIFPASLNQWPFDPSGNFYPKEKLPEDLNDFSHVAILRNYNPDWAIPLPGVYNIKGEVYRFSSLNTSATHDLRRILFEFTTVQIGGYKYKFAGEFLNNHIFEDYVKDPNEVVARGVLIKYKRDEKVAEATVEFTYSAILRQTGLDVDVRRPSGKTALMKAAQESDVETVRALLARGANTNIKGPGSMTALRYAMWGRGGKQEIIRMLLAAGADVNAKDEYGETALMAAVYDKTDLVQLFLSAGADANAKTKKGSTALISAVGAIGQGLGSLENVKALLRAGADVNVRDAFGKTALSIAKEERNEELASLLRQAGAKP